MRGGRWTGLLLAGATLLTGGCGDDGEPTAGDVPVPTVAALTQISGEGQSFRAGRRAPESFSVRAEDVDGRPVAGTTIAFMLEGDADGIITQPRALTDEDGVAETWLLDVTPGQGLLRARAEEGGAAVSWDFTVVEGPGEIRFLEASGAVGLPGHPHPDSVLEVEVLDTDGNPMEGAEVWFSAPGTLTNFNDTTDASGRASTILRRSALFPGNQRVHAFMLGFQDLQTSTHRTTVAAAEKVILVSIDGLRGDAIERLAPPELTRLAQEGSFTSRARTVLPSLTVPGHLSLLSGVGPDKHGVYSDQVSLTPEMNALEPLFLKARQVGFRTRAFMSAHGPLEGFETALACRLAFGLDSLTLVEAGAREIADSAGPVLSDPNVELIFVHLPDPDLAGHAHGWSSPEYERAVFRADSAVGTIVRAAVESGDELLVIVTSDHGGGGAYGDFLHGSTAEVDVEIPLILWGERVVAGSEPRSGTTILDVAPTALWALGVPPPGRYRGRVLLDSFH